MKLINDEIKRFKGADFTPYKVGVLKENIYVKGYDEKGDLVKVRKERGLFFDENNNKKTIELWEYDEHQNKCFYNIKKIKPVFSKDVNYIIGVDSFGNEFLTYEKEGDLYMYSNDKKAFVILWRYLDVNCGLKELLNKN